jgi:serine/threonine protein kinase
VAVKVLKKPLKVSAAEWQEMQDNLVQEAQRLAKATHQHVVCVHHVEYAASGELQLVMERCTGSIATRYEQGPIDLATVRDVATAIAMGLECIHAREMLHRDIKPANILLDQQGRAKLGDFGLVTDKIVYGYASVGDKKYAPHLAKEIWEGLGTSRRTDVWALGMTLYRLVHGEEWYDTRAPDFLLIQRGKYAQKLPWLPHVPKQWRNFIRKCLHDDQSHRFQDANGVLSNLANLPVAPNWICTYASAATSWSVTEGDRKIVVDWSTAGKKWSATSLPLKDGRRRSLGGSGSVRDLEEFFQNRYRDS